MTHEIWLNLMAHDLKRSIKHWDLYLMMTINSPVYYNSVLDASALTFIAISMSR